MNALKVETTMRDMIRKGNLSDAKNLGLRFLKENGPNSTIQYLVASVYFALQDYVQAWFFIHRNADSELKKQIFSKIRWLYPEP